MRAPFAISPGLSEREWVRLCADASSDGSSALGPRVSAVIVTQKGEFYYTVSDDLPEGRRTDFYGAAPALPATRSFPDLLSDKRPAAGIDNTTDCYAFVRAPHKDAQTATAISLSPLDMKKAGPRPLFARITPEKNIADWGSGEDLRWLMDHFAGAVFRGPAAVDEWRSPGALLKTLRAVGADIAEDAAGGVLAAESATEPKRKPCSEGAESWAGTLVDFPWAADAESLPQGKGPASEGLRKETLPEAAQEKRVWRSG